MFQSLITNLEFCHYIELQLNFIPMTILFAVHHYHLNHQSVFVIFLCSHLTSDFGERDKI